MASMRLCYATFMLPQFSTSLLIHKHMNHRNINSRPMSTA